MDAKQRPDDDQCSSLYRAEEVLIDYSFPLSSIGEITAFIAATLNRPAIRRRYEPVLKVSIRIDPGPDDDQYCAAWATHTQIVMPEWSWTAYIALHELAHVLAQRMYGRWAIAAHGREFASIYADLVRFSLGRNAHAALRRSLKLHNVSIGAPAPPIHKPDYSFKAKAKNASRSL